MAQTLDIVPHKYEPVHQQYHTQGTEHIIPPSQNGCTYTNCAGNGMEISRGNAPPPPTDENANNMNSTGTISISEFAPIIFLMRDDARTWNSARRAQIDQQSWTAQSLLIFTGFFLVRYSTKIQRRGGDDIY